MRSAAEVDLIEGHQACLLAELPAQVAQDDDWDGDVAGKEVGDGETADERSETVEQEDDGEEEYACPSKVRLQVPPEGELRPVDTLSASFAFQPYLEHGGLS